MVCHNALHLAIFSGYNIRIMISCYNVIHTKKTLREF